MSTPWWDVLTQWCLRKAPSGRRRCVAGMKVSPEWYSQAVEVALRCVIGWRGRRARTREPWRRALTGLGEVW